jgi:hypothetical protein
MVGAPGFDALEFVAFVSFGVKSCMQLVIPGDLWIAAGIGLRFTAPIY